MVDQEGEFAVYELANAQVIRIAGNGKVHSFEIERDRWTARIECSEDAQSVSLPVNCR